MLYGTANGCSQWFRFRRSVASGLENHCLQGSPGENWPSNPRFLKIFVVLLTEFWS